MNLLEVRNICKTYGSGETSVKALKDVSFSVPRGEYVAVVGESGSGKSTVARCLMNIYQPSGGEILFDGENIAVHGLEYYRRNHVSLIFQSYNLIDYMTPVENVKLTARQGALPTLERLGLSEEEARRNVLKLSGGQQQRVAIARTLASGAPFILADEPTGNLDEDTAAEITGILKESAHELNKCVIVVTHSNELAKQADVILKLKRGSLQTMKTQQ